MSGSFIATLEFEPVDRHRFSRRAESPVGVFRFIEGFCNPSRRRSSIGYMAPAELWHPQSSAPPIGPPMPGRS